MIIGKKRILLLSIGLLILAMAALMFTGCDKLENPGPGPGATPGEYVNIPDAPITINSIYIQSAPMFYDLFLDFTNNTPKIITQTEICILLFDENGDPVFDTHAQGSAKIINSKKQMVPYGKMSGRWLVQLGTHNVKGHLVRVTYYDGSTWEAPGLAEWLEAEIAKY